MHSQRTTNMDARIYEFLMGASAFIIAILGFMLAATTISLEDGLKKLRKARNILVPSYFVLALLSLVCCLTGYDRRVEPSSTLFVASFQALLFTMSMLVFIRPAEVKWRTVFWHAGGITAAGALLFVALFCFTDYFSWFFYAGLVGYVFQLMFYTQKFTLAYRKTVKDVEDYYDEDSESRLTWVKIGFYSALGIGIMAILILFYPTLYLFFVPLYVIFYSFMLMWFVNYYHKMKFAIPVISPVCQYEPGMMETKDIKEESDKMQENVCTDMERLLQERLQRYIDEKEYCRKDVPSEEVAALLGTTKSFLRRYMSTHYSMWFSTWRNELRIQEACRLYQEDPTISIMAMAEKIGYANNGNFCRDFKKIVGVTPREYCMQKRSGVAGTETDSRTE